MLLKRFGFGYSGSFDRDGRWMLCTQSTPMYSRLTRTRLSRFRIVIRVWSRYCDVGWSEHCSAGESKQLLRFVARQWFRDRIIGCVACKRTADDYAIASIDWWHPGRPADVDERWQTLCTLARHHDELELSIWVEVPLMDEWINPTLYCNVRPGLLDAILGVADCSVAGWPVIKHEPLEGLESVVRYLTGTLLNRNRKIPAVLISGQLLDDQPVVDRDEFRQTLFGLADVAVLKNKDAGYKLTHAMGNKMLSCFDGAVRVYWPGFRLEDDPYAHNLWLRELIQRDDDNGQSLLRHLIQQLTDYGIEHRPDRVLQAVRAIVAPSRPAFEENSDAVTPTAILPMPKSRFRSVEEVVHQAKNRFRETMVFLDSAFSSAHASNYGQPDEIWKLFETLHTIALQWQADKRLRAGWYQAMKEVGLSI